MEIKGSSDAGAVSHHILPCTGSPHQKHSYFWRKWLLCHFGFDYQIHQHKQALLSSAVFSCFCLINRTLIQWMKKIPCGVKGPRKVKICMSVNDPGNCQNLTSYFRYTMCNNTFFPCSELWSTLWRISAWKKQLAVPPAFISGCTNAKPERSPFGRSQQLIVLV